MIKGRVADMLMEEVKLAFQLILQCISRTESPRSCSPKLESPKY
jgi:hypothetical protein